MSRGSACGGGGAWLTDLRFDRVGWQAGGGFAEALESNVEGRPRVGRGVAVEGGAQIGLGGQRRRVTIRLRHVAHAGPGPSKMLKTFKALINMLIG